MKIKPYIDRLNSSKEFKEFKEKYRDAFMTAGFFVLDLEFGKNIHQIDYYVPSEKKVAAFTLDRGVVVQLLDTLSGKLPEHLDINTKVDLDALQGILQDEMKNRSITEEIKKIIAIVQNIEGKKIWNLNCVLSGMEILRAHIDDESQTVLKMDKSSILDYVRKITPQPIRVPETENDVKKELSKLNKLESEIEKEREILNKQLEKSSKRKSATKNKQTNA